MQKIHLHTPGWMHRPQWQTLKTGIEHLIHDPRFWAVLALGALVILMLLTLILGEGGTRSSTSPMYPTFPYAPY